MIEYSNFFTRMLPHIFLKERVFIVAEVGKNFIQTEDERPVAEYLSNAKKLASVARASGADAVKFQTHDSEDEVLDIDFDSPHFKGHSRYQWVLRNARATPVEEFWRPLKEYCDEIGIIFFSTPMSRGAARKLDSLGVPFWKVASSDILDFVMLDFMARSGKEIMIPSGMSTLAEIDQCMDFLNARHARFILLHAISRYPYPAEDSNLLTIPFFHDRYPAVTIGFSQNSPWIEPAILSVALGARVVEQHITLDRALWGPDHKVSMTPDEFRSMAMGIRAVEGDEAEARAVRADPAMQKYMGEKGKLLQRGEVAFRGLFRKALVAARDMPPGAVVHSEDLYAMRPQEFIRGLPSEAYEGVLGRKISSPLKKYDPITEAVLGG